MTDGGADEEGRREGGEGGDGPSKFGPTGRGRPNGFAATAAQDFRGLGERTKSG